MPFDPNFDLSKFQQKSQFNYTDGRFHVRVVNIESGLCEQDLSVATAREAHVETKRVRDEGGKAAVVVSPSNTVLDVYYVQGWDWDSNDGGGRVDADDGAADPTPPQTGMVSPVVETLVMPGTEWVEPGTGSRVRKLAQAVSFTRRFPLPAGAKEAKRAVEDLLRMVGPGYKTRLRLTGERFSEEDLKRMQSLPDRTKDDLNQKKP